MSARRDEVAVSNVLGAVLMFGLLILTMVVIQVRFVPVWTEDKEAAHMEQVLGQMSQVSSDLARTVGNQTTAVVSDPIRLDRSGGFKFFNSATVPATLSFQGVTAGSGVSLTSPRLLIIEQNGEELVGIADQSSWIPLDNSGDTYGDVANLRVFRIQIPWPADPNDCNTDLVAIVHIRDVLNQELAKVIVTCHDSSSERSINVAIYRKNAVSDPSFSQVSGDTEAIFQNADADFFYIDLLRSDLVFRPVLAAMDGPFNISLEKQGLSASYLILFDDSTGGTQGGGASLIGRSIAPYPSSPTTYDGGVIRLSAQNQRFVPQDYVIENGAVLRVQGTTAAMAVPPRLRIDPGTLQTFIEWDLPTVHGVDNSLSGAKAASVQASRGGGGTDFLALGAELTIRIPTSYPSAWEAWLRQEFAEAGLTSSQYSFAAPSPTSVTVTIIGLSASASTNDLLIRFHQAPIDVDLRSSG